MGFMLKDKWACCVQIQTQDSPGDGNLRPSLVPHPFGGAAMLIYVMVSLFPVFKIGEHNSSQMRKPAFLYAPVATGFPILRTFSKCNKTIKINCGNGFNPIFTWFCQQFEAILLETVGVFVIVIVIRTKTMIIIIIIIFTMLKIIVIILVVLIQNDMPGPKHYGPD